MVGWEESGGQICLRQLPVALWTDRREVGFGGSEVTVWIHLADPG